MIFKKCFKERHCSGEHFSYKYLLNWALPSKISSTLSGCEHQLFILCRAHGNALVLSSGSFSIKYNIMSGCHFLDPM